MEKEWYTIKEISEELEITITRANQLVKREISKRPGTSLVRKVRNEKNAPRYEMHYTLYREIEADRIKDAFKGVKEYIENSEPKPAQAYTAAPEEDPYPPVGATYTLEDGTIVERWTPERYRVLEQELLALDSLRRTAEMHQVEIERLQVSYEAHIATYENQVNYLRESLTKNIELANKMAVLMEQRNYIEANTKTNNQ
jgi:hypothetical protein